MKRRTLLQTIPGLAVLPSAARAGLLEAAAGKNADAPEGSTVVYELRVYHANPGKLDDLLKRFRDHTMALFEKHGMKNVAYWVPTDEPVKANTLIYILEHPSREAATKNWQAFRDDPDWKSVQAKSEENGKLVEKVDSTFMALTDFSPKVR